MISPNVILIWGGSNASIPAGWVRVTALDSKFPKAWGAENPNVTGGNATHSHTSNAHTHTMASHSHLVGTGTAVLGDERGNNGGSSSPSVFHTHPGNVAGVTSGSISNAVTYASVNALPPYYEVIFIKPSILRPIPDNVIVLWNSANLPGGFKITNGADETIDLRNKYLRGASTDADAGTIGGSLNHSHVVNHNHTTVSHGHSAQSGNATPMDMGTGSGPGTDIAGQHKHSVVLPGVTSPTNSYVGSAGIADDVEPAYHKLLAIQNKEGENMQARFGMIGLWLGTVTTIPIGWVLCDGENATPDLRNKYIKIANTAGEIGNEGGSNTHVHAASNSHTHTATGTHTHSSGGYTGWFGSNAYAIAGGSQANSPIIHRHQVNSVGNATASYNPSTISANVSSNEPEYRTVAYIMFKYFAAGGILLSLI